MLTFTREARVIDRCLTVPKLVNLQPLISNHSNKIIINYPRFLIFASLCFPTFTLISHLQSYRLVSPFLFQRELFNHGSLINIFSCPDHASKHVALERLQIVLIKGIN